MVYSQNSVPPNISAGSVSALSSDLFQKRIVSKFLDLKVKSVSVKDFLISTKVEPKRVEHLHQKEIFP